MSSISFWHVPCISPACAHYTHLHSLCGSESEMLVSLPTTSFITQLKSTVAGGGYTPSPNTFTFMHLADAFIQSDLHYIQVTGFFYILSALAFPGNRTHDLGVASTMLYHLSYRKALHTHKPYIALHDLHCIQVTVFFLHFISYCFPWESYP